MSSLGALVASPMRSILGLGLGLLVLLSPGVAGAAQASLGNGVAGASATVCPGTADRKLDGFSLVTDTGSDAVTGLTVTTTGFAAIQSASIWSEAGTAQYFSTVTAPASNTLVFGGGTPIPVSTTTANYKVVVTYRGEAQAPPAGSTATSAAVSAISTTNPVAGSDAADGTVTLNNVTPAPGATWGTNAAGDGQATLNWTLGTAGNRTLVVRYTANVDATLPVDGTTYAVGGAFGAGGTVRYDGTASSFTDTGLANGTTYFFRIFEHDGCNNYVATAGAAPWSPPLTPRATTTLGGGVAGTSRTVCPGTTGQKLGGFSLVNSQGTVPVTGLTVTTTGFAAIQTASIWDEAGTTQYFTTITTPASNTLTFAGGTPIPVSTTPANYKVVVSYRGEAQSPPAGSTTTTAAVSALTTANAVAGADTADATLTLHNVTPVPGASWGSTVVVDRQATLNWTMGRLGNRVLIVRYQASLDTTFPVDGTTYAIGDAFGAGGTVRYADVGTILTDPGLAVGTTYSYRAFEYDGCNNYVASAATAPWSPALAVAAAPVVTTGAASAVTLTTAQLAGTANPGGAATTGWFRYATVNPGTCNDTFGFRAPVSGGSAFGAGLDPVAWSQGIAGLDPGTTYYVCAIAQNSTGTSFGAPVSFTTPRPPAVTTLPAAPVAAGEATLNATVNPSGATTTGWFRYATANPGTCNDTFGFRAPVSGGSVLGAGLDPVSFSRGLTGLAPATTYWFCAIASSANGTSLGEVVSFTTSAIPPTVAATTAALVSGSTARLDAAANPNGDATTAWFRYATTNPGTCDDGFGTRAPAAGGAALGSGRAEVAFSQPLTGLTPGATYHACALAQNAAGIAVGTLTSFTTPLPPAVATAPATDLTDTAATLNGSATPGGAETTGWFRYATTNPGACSDAFGTRAPASGGAALGSGASGVAWAQPLTGLAPATTYWFCAVAGSAEGTAFGELRTFTTAGPPGVATSAATAVTAGGATLNGSATPGGAATTGWFRYATTSPGACDDTFGTRAPATGGAALGAGAAPVAFSQPLTGLAPGTTYHACAIASSAYGTSFGALVTFTTAASAPVATTAAATAITATGALLNGEATPGGAATTGWFRYATASPGTCDDTFGIRAPAAGGAALGAGAAPVAFSQALTGLTPATTYHACAIASNAEGTAFGSPVTFTTPAAPPVATTQGASLVSSTGALLQASVTPNGDATTAWFRLAASHPGACSDAFGTRLPDSGGAAVGSGGAPVAIAQAVTGLSPGTTSFFCAIAENGAGLALGEVQSFTTWDGPTVTTREVAGLGPDGATLQGTADPHLADTTGWFRYGPVDPVGCDDAFGTRVPETGGTALGAGAGPVDFAAPVTGLLPGRTYHACALAGSEVGTRFGEVVAFTTATAAPVVTTEAPTGVEAGAAVLHGAADPNGEATTGWFRYDTVPPAVCDDAFGVRLPAAGGEPLGGGTGPVAWAAPLSGLSPATTYYACAIAANAVGTGVGGVVTFRTGVVAPAVATLPATDLTADGATLEGTATPNGSDSTGWFRVGDADPGTCDDAFGARVPATGGLALGAGFAPATFSLAQAGLEPARTYFYCAAAANLGGAAFGAPVAFTTAAAAPAVRTVAATAGEPGAATLQGAANPRGTAAQGWFRYAATAPASCTDAFGVRVPASAGTDLGAGRGEVAFSQALSGLAPGTWWYCAIASGAGGTAFGALLSVQVAAPPAAPAGGCGCGPGAAGGAGSLWLAALLLLRRRRSPR